MTRRTGLPTTTRGHDGYHFVGEDSGIHQWITDGNKAVNCHGQEYNRFHACVGVDKEHLDEAGFKAYSFLWLNQKMASILGIMVRSGQTQTNKGEEPGSRTWVDEGSGLS